MAVGNQSLLQQQQQQNLRMLTMVNAVKSPRVFDDDRDLVITRFNVLQACSGVGKGIARVEGQNDPQSVDFTPENPFCKFKVCRPLLCSGVHMYIRISILLLLLYLARQTLCYNRLPTSRNEDGLVMLQFNKLDSLLLSEQEAVTRALQSIVNSATVQVVVDTIRPLPDNWCAYIYKLLPPVLIGVMQLHSYMYIRCEEGKEEER